MRQELSWANPCHRASPPPPAYLEIGARLSSEQLHPLPQPAAELLLPVGVHGLCQVIFGRDVHTARLRLGGQQTQDRQLRDHRLPCRPREGGGGHTTDGEAAVGSNRTENTLPTLAVRKAIRGAAENMLV